MSERIHAKKSRLRSAAQAANGLEASPRKRVREQRAPLHRYGTAGRTLSRLAHPSNRLIALLNGRWRVIDDPLQWILQRKNGSPRKKNSGWQSVSFCRTREALLRCVRELCCSVDEVGSRCTQQYRGLDPHALRQLLSLPEWHRDWDRRNLDAHRTDRAQSDAGLELLAAKALEDSNAEE